MRLEQSKRTGLTLVAAGLIATALALRRARARNGYSFSGRAVIITGGSRGLGLVLARRLAVEGARLMLVARDQQELGRAIAAVRADSPSAAISAVAADVTRPDEVERAIAATIDRFGRVDVVINNAGIIQVGPFDHMQLSDFADALKTHFWGPLFVTLAALPHMRRQGGGRIVNISSIGGRVAVPHLLPYSASKFALVGLSDGLRAELARDHIAVTTVCPGLMRTGSPVNASFKGRRDREYSWFAVASSLPLLTISAERAANQVVEACRRGDAELVITPQAKVAALARAVAPELLSDVMSLVNRVLPRAAGTEGDLALPGRLANAGRMPSMMLGPMRAAAQRNNEL